MSGVSVCRCTTTLSTTTLLSPAASSFVTEKFSSSFQMKIDKDEIQASECFLSLLILKNKMGIVVLVIRAPVSSK